MKAITRYTLLVVLLALSGVVGAEERLDPTARAKLVAPFIDELAVAVVYVDLTHVDVDATVDKLAGLFPEAEIDQQAGPGLKQMQRAFLQAGFKELYAVVSLAEIVRAPACFIAPITEGADVQELIDAALPSLHGFQVVQRRGDVVLLCSGRRLEQLASLAPDERPELAKAFEAADDREIQIVLSLPKHTRRVIEELLPELPEEIGGGPSTILTQGLLWATLGIDCPPELGLRLHVQSEDGPAAAAFSQKWLDIVRLLVTFSKQRDKMRQYDQMQALLSPAVEGDHLAIDFNREDGSIDALMTAITPPLEMARARARRAQSTNNLKQIAIAMHNHHDTYKKFPGVGSMDDEGQPLLSWRVQILPFLEQKKLYDQFHLDEPWDSQHNRTLIEEMPAVFHCPNSSLKLQRGLSVYRVVVGKDTVFTGGKGIQMKQIKDGTSNTIMVVEVDDDHAVAWTKPEGLPFDPDQPARGLGGQTEGGFNAAYCDGSVRFLELPHDPDNLRARFTRAGGEVVPRD